MCVCVCVCVRARACACWCAALCPGWGTWLDDTCGRVAGFRQSAQRRRRQACSGQAECGARPAASGAVRVGNIAAAAGVAAGTKERRCAVVVLARESGRVLRPARGSRGARRRDRRKAGSAGGHQSVSARASERVGHRTRTRQSSALSARACPLRAPAGDHAEG